MKILLLGNEGTRLSDFLLRNEDTIITNEKINKSTIYSIKPDFVISYNYKYIINDEIIQLFTQNNIINLHISLLPWNRGADPNFWSFIDKTPKGVTIHCLTNKLDAGDILLQEEIFFSDEETLSSSYIKLQNLIQDLFINNWVNIKTRRIIPYPQPKGGTYHRTSDKDNYFKKLPDGWETKIKVLNEIIDYEVNHGNHCS
ncbi:formyltransferase family protein [Marispirochaeta aestuarii]|uniref:formyltransferase family protein n=1 Tax=Marispirochaeta aestuarii TaxID=1963862 RepID=UPI0029C8A381|nr:formyltransferase family protein [Marispirochaeta aestuarii]